MARKQEEEFELVVGNKHLLSLFFLVVVLFAVFFAWGYTVGKHRSGSPGPADVMAIGPETDPPADEDMLPKALLEAPPKVTTAAPKPAARQPSPAPTQAKVAKPSPTPKAAAKKAAARPKPKPVPAATTASAAAKGLHLQVAALRVGKDAQALAGTLKGKGYPATVNDGMGDGWFRVVVGPFSSAKAAESMKAKLGKDGFDSMARQF